MKRVNVAEGIAKNHKSLLSKESGSKLIKEVKYIFRNFLKGKNLKITQEREKIVECIFKINHHFNVELLEQKLQKAKISASRATIYRTLDLLVESKLVDKIHFGETSTSYYYEYIYGQKHHYHLICKKCYQIIEFISKKISSIQDEICKKFNFSVLEHQFKIFGICYRCRQDSSVVT